MSFNQQIELILEKDHRLKMIKFGIPSDVADFLHNLDSKYSIWFANELKKISGFQNADNKINWIQAHVLTNIRGILDWVKGVPNILLKNYDWEGANKAQKEWHDSLETQKLEKLETNKIIKRYDSGFYWVDLEGTRCPEEAKLMGHCASTSAETLWSLRKYTAEATNQIESFITMGVSPSEGIWTQCKGKKNSKPKEIYWPYIANILVSNNILIFKSEYDARNDFTSHNLVEYIEENQEEFSDWEELIEKIKANQISYDHFEKVLKEEKCDKMKYFSIWLDENSGYEDSILCRIGFGFEIPLAKFGDYWYNVQRHIERSSEYGGEDSKLSKDLINFFSNKVFSYSYNWTRLYINDEQTDLVFQCDIDDDDTYLSLTDEGLRTFRERICQNYKYEDNHIDEKKLYEEVLEFFIDTGVIPDLNNPDAHSIIKPIKPEDPKQLKFPFINESKIRFKQFVNL